MIRCCLFCALILLTACSESVQNPTPESLTEFEICVDNWTSQGGSEPKAEYWCEYLIDNQL